MTAQPSVPVGFTPNISFTDSTQAKKFASKVFVARNGSSQQISPELLALIVTVIYKIAMALIECRKNAHDTKDMAQQLRDGRGFLVWWRRRKMRRIVSDYGLDQGYVDDILTAANASTTNELQALILEASLV